MYQPSLLLQVHVQEERKEKKKLCPLRSSSKLLLSCHTTIRNFRMQEFFSFVHAVMIFREAKLFAKKTLQHKCSNLACVCAWQ